MRRQLRLAFAALTLALLLGSADGSAAWANEAGLVVEHGDGSVTYVFIVFSEEELTSIELLRRSGLSLSTVSSGGFGEAVCSIDNEGCGVSECRTRLCQTGDPDSPFWKFFRVGSSGSWVMQPLGASATRVRGGEVDLWAWTGGEAGVPTIDLARIIDLTNAPDDRTADAVYVAWFNAEGNPFVPGSGSGPDWIQFVAGTATLIALSGIAVVLVGRKRSRAVSQEPPP